MKDSLREIAHRFLGSCVWQCQEEHTEDCDALVKAIHSHTQALVAAAYAACANHITIEHNEPCDWECLECGIEGHGHWSDHIRSLTPADAARELERREDTLVQTAFQIFVEKGGYMASSQEVRQRLASLSKPAPVERSNENG